VNLSGRQILYDSRNHAWSYGWTFYQMLADALARDNEVVYLDAPVSLARIRGAEMPLLRGARVEENGRVRVLRSATIPAQRRPWQQALAARLAAGATARWARREGFDPDIVWCYMPSALELLDRFPRASSFYWTGDEVVMPRERELLERVDAILCVSDPVHDRHRETYGDRAHFVPVACDFERHHAALGAGADELRGLERPLLGYSGFVNDRFDVELLADLCARLTSGTVVVAGPVGHEQRRALEGLPRLVLLGPQPAERVPRLIDSFDVALIPYADSTFNRSSNPVKLYEYLALGKPVVSTDIPTLRRFAQVASIGPRETFVERVLEGGVPGTVDERVAVARDHSFDALLARLRALPS
jgi:glycosyltransferase involved in cell wall biosynthesis